jgi:hypothetical protein
VSTAEAHAMTGGEKIPLLVWRLSQANPETAAWLDAILQRLADVESLAAGWLEAQPGDVDRHYAARRILEILQ